MAKKAKPDDDEIKEEKPSINPEHLEPQKETGEPSRPKVADPKHLKPQE